MNRWLSSRDSQNNSCLPIKSTNSKTVVCWICCFSLGLKPIVVERFIPVSPRQVYFVFFGYSLWDICVHTYTADSALLSSVDPLLCYSLLIITFTISDRVRKPEASYTLSAYMYYICILLSSSESTFVGLPGRSRV